MGCKRLPPSKRVIYVLFLLFFASDSLVSSGLDNLVYNKLCVENGTDIQLCTNNTFTQLHDHIQVNHNKLKSLMKKRGGRNYVSVPRYP